MSPVGRSASAQSPAADRARLIHSTGPWLVDLVAAVLVVVGATQLVSGVLPWRLPPRYLVEVWAIGASHLALAAFTARLSREAARSLAPALAVALAGMMTFLGAYLLLVLLGGSGSDGPSRGLIVYGMALSLALTVPRVMPDRRGRMLVPVLGILAVVIGGRLLRGRFGRAAAPNDSVSTISTGFLPIEVRVQAGLTGPAIGDGGAIVRLGNGFVVITGRGLLFQLDWDASKQLFRSTRIPLPPPMDRAAYLADQADTVSAMRLRVTGMTVDTTVNPARLYVSHQEWSKAGKCFTLNVSSAAMTLDSASQVRGNPWTREFESKPCLPPTKGFDDIEAGGRLAWTRDRALLLTIGDFGYDGIEVNDLVQSADADYGKVMRRDPASHHWSRFTSGHRNPQGLWVDRQGVIWETEHGPQGGDELNQLVAGRNYGWPLVTYGAQYGSRYWPRNPEGKDHRGFAEPTYAFVPSIGVSNLIGIEGDAFPQWTGDLMLSSLRARSLWRTRVRDGRVIYVEQIPIGRRIRDLVQGATGQIVIWTDEGDIVRVASSDRGSTPESAYELCRGCHEAAPIGTAIAPRLRGVINRPVAGDGNYSYSAALKQLGGNWRAERIDSFLRDPGGYAPGTKMSFGGVVDATERQKVIEYLRSYR